MTVLLDHYAVMGNPIAHSKSPRIHALFAAQTGQNLEYRAILVEADGFAAAARAFRDAGGKGLNVTVPFKQDAWVFADLLSARAERAGAVNTLVFDATGVRGDNTDGPGLVRDLTGNHGCPLADKKILLLGAGGAARGVLQPLLAERPAQLVIANRTVAKAVELTLRFSDLGRVSGCGFADLAGRRFDLIVNATAAGLHDAVPPLPDGVLATDGWCYDLMYGKEPTAFVRWGWAQGAVHSLDGLGMLVEQAAESFHLWRGVWPETKPVIEALRAR
ncbi:shikimate dehydrogenase [Candidatus Competibacter phosphatis]|uniref:Shikimate dehydrogenase (NADP(+)) n=1 Tax=Candidatus Competibacter phosphatis TaxID=221280 RepID=A0ABX1TQH7_9GAMM|nr:shikimate dehydrogenase [Candidatus Competibacter phosphatis]NMQ20196.1 shikimate dehydrogenase [Candidatus Competibacter phosphatis]